MRLNNILKPALIMSERKATSFMNSRKPTEYQLVDVRLPEEYEDYHLPGALLIPLPELTTGKGDLDTEKPTIVYCRSGGRSQAASQWLVGQGFKEVYDISHHIADWQGIQATGAYEVDLNLIVPEADFDDVWQLSYAMEEGLQSFYRQLEEAEQNQELKALYNRLAGFEDYHKKRLLDGYTEFIEGAQADDLIQSTLKIMEGGKLTRRSPQEVIKSVSNVMDIFGLAMAIESQSYDLYIRLSREAEKEAVQNLLVDMAEEETQHLDYLSQELVKHIN